MESSSSSSPAAAAAKAEAVASDAATLDRRKKNVDSVLASYLASQVGDFNSGSGMQELTSQPDVGERTSMVFEGGGVDLSQGEASAQRGAFITAPGSAKQSSARPYYYHWDSAAAKMKEIQEKGRRGSRKSGERKKGSNRNLTAQLLREHNMRLLNAANSVGLYGESGSAGGGGQKHQQQQNGTQEAASGAKKRIENGDDDEDDDGDEDEEMEGEMEQSPREPRPAASLADDRDAESITNSKASTRMSKKSKKRRGPSASSPLPQPLPMPFEEMTTEECLSYLGQPHRSWDSALKELSRVQQAIEASEVRMQSTISSRATGCSPSRMSGYSNASHYSTASAPAGVFCGSAGRNRWGRPESPGDFAATFGSVVSHAGTATLAGASRDKSSRSRNGRAGPSGVLCKGRPQQQQQAKGFLISGTNPSSTFPVSTREAFGAGSLSESVKSEPIHYNSSGGGGSSSKDGAVHTHNRTKKSSVHGSTHGSVGSFPSSSSSISSSYSGSSSNASNRRDGKTIPTRGGGGGQNSGGKDEGPNELGGFILAGQNAASMMTTGSNRRPTDTNPKGRTTVSTSTKISSSVNGGGAARPKLQSIHRDDDSFASSLFVSSSTANRNPNRQNAAATIHATGENAQQRSSQARNSTARKSGAQTGSIILGPTCTAPSSSASVPLPPLSGKRK